MKKQLLAVLVAVTFGNACTYALRPRTTREGKPFDATQADAIQIGQTEAEVLSIMGEPLESTTDAGLTTWRYYERYTPRGCDPPIVSRELRVKFVARLVVAREPASRSDGLPNNELQRTKPAQATELRR